MYFQELRLLLSSKLIGVLAFISVVLLNVAPIVARAGTLQVDPVLVEIGAARRTGLVRIRNVETQPITIRAYALDWSQTTGEDVYSENNTDLILSPPVFTIPGGGTQNLRMGPRRSTVIGRAYRLMIEEVPEARIAGAVQVAIRLNIPLYVNVPAGASANLIWSASRSADGRYVVEATNTGKGYVRLERSAVTAATGLTIGDDVNLGTVLPASTRRWILKSGALVSNPEALRRISRVSSATSSQPVRRN